MSESGLNTYVNYDNWFYVYSQPRMDIVYERTHKPNFLVNESKGHVNIGHDKSWVTT